MNEKGEEKIRISMNLSSGSEGRLEGDGIKSGRPDFHEKLYIFILGG